MKKRVVLPAAFILDLDDVMWHAGFDLRHIGQASRSEFPRYHVAQDYEIIHQLGKALNMKICCPICLGDWDRENVLRGVVGATHDPYGWDRKSKIDYNACNAYFQAAEASEYIDYAYHGLLHGLYGERGERLNEWEYFRMNADQQPVMLSDGEIETHLDLFDRIYHAWDFQKKIRCFCPPCGIPLADKTNWSELERLSRLLYKRGVRYIIARWQSEAECSRVNSGVLYMEKHVRFGVSSAAYDVDPRYIPRFANEDEEAYGDVLGMHWTNFLHYHPQNNLARLEQWVEWFQEQAEVFGVMLSRDIAFTGNQCIYRKNSTVEVMEDSCIIDVSGARALDFDDLGDVFYVSFRNDSLPKQCIGGDMRLYESKKNFKTYRVQIFDNVIRFDF